MYTIAVIDDENYTRAFLKDYINNNVADYEVVACLKNGEEAIAWLSENNVNVVISDIKMPKKDGIEIAKWLCENRKETKTILITAYEDFDYAYKAIKYKVFAYLLKAIDTKELVQVLEDIKVNYLVPDKTADILDVYIAREEILSKMISGSIQDKDTLVNALVNKNIYLNAECVRLLRYDIDFLNMKEVLGVHWQYGKEAFRVAILQFIENLFENCYVVYSDMTGNGITVIAAVDNMDISEQNAAGIICREVENVFGLYNNVSFIAGEYFLIENRDKIKKLIGYRYINLLIQGSNGKNDGKSENRIIENAVKYIHEHWNEDISRDNVAEAVCLQGVYFGRIFKKHTGISINECILKIRMERAMELLKQNQKINIVGAKVGYNSDRQFRRVFKNYTGLTPAEYKKSIFRIE